MRTAKNYVGTKIGKFEILEQEYRNKTLYLKAKCTLCGKVAWIAQKHIAVRKCCESKISTTQFKALDLKGQIINGIEILEKTDKKRRGAYLWKCKCHCGNIFYAEGCRIKNGEISSCGCKRRVYRENNFKQARKVLSSNYKDGTCIALIKNNKLRTTNKSGIVGVYYSNSKHKWVAHLMCQNKAYQKAFKNKEDAIKYRKELEEKYFKPILEKYKAD